MARSKKNIIQKRITKLAKKRKFGNASNILGYDARILNLSKAFPKYYAPFVLARLDKDLSDEEDVFEGMRKDIPEQKFGEISEEKRELAGIKEDKFPIPHGKDVIKKFKQQIINAKKSGKTNISFNFDFSLVGSSNRKDIGRGKTFRFNIRNKTIKNISKTIKKEIDEYFGFLFDVTKGSIISIDQNDLIFIEDGKSPSGKGIGPMALNDIDFIKIDYDVSANHREYNYNCVGQYLIENYKKFKIGKYKFLKKEKWTVNSLIKFCKKHKLSFRLYDRRLKLIKSKKFKGIKSKSLIGICANEHLYPLTYLELRRLRKYKKDEFLITKVKLIKKKEMFELVDKKMIKTPVKKFNMDYKKSIGMYISRILFEKTLYITDKDTFDFYNLMKGTISNFDMIIPFNLTPNKLLSWYLGEENKSIAFNFLKKPKPCIFYNKILEIYGDVKCIDKNKAYLYALLKLKYIPKITFATPITKIEGNHEFSKYNFYHICKIKKDMFGIIDNVWCSGYRFKQIRKYVVCDAYIKPILIKNPFPALIEPLLKKNPDLIKYLINKFIGYIQIESKGNTINIFEHIITNEDELNHFLKDINYGSLKFNKNFYAIFKQIHFQAKVANGFMPLAHYVIDSNVNRVIKTMNKLKEEDPTVRIVKIKTDSISYIGKADKLMNMIISKKNIKGWKIEEYKTGKNNIIKHNNLEIVNFEKTSIDMGNYYNCYAGSGKTYFAVNTLIPSILEKEIALKKRGIPEEKLYIFNIDDSDSEDEEKKIELTKKEISECYCVLCYQHTSLFEYRKNKNKCSTLSSYLFRTKRAKQKHIIIDEAGLVPIRMYNQLFSIINTETKLYLMGDSNQLFPVEDSINNKKFTVFDSYNLKSYFGKKEILDENHRNHYTTQDYDEMINGTFILTERERNLMDEREIIKKVENIFDDGKNPYYITHSRNKAIEINNNIVNNLSISYGYKTFEYKRKELKYGKGLIIKCTANEIQMKIKGIFNKYIFEIIKIKKKEIIIQPYSYEYNKTFGEKSEITLIEFVRFFDYGYAHTLASTQGSSIPEDILCICEFKKMEYFGKGKAVYTLFSRMKNKK